MYCFYWIHWIVNIRWGHHVTKVPCKCVLFYSWCNTTIHTYGVSSRHTTIVFLTFILSPFSSLFCLTASTVLCMALSGSANNAYVHKVRLFPAHGNHALHSSRRMGTCHNHLTCLSCYEKGGFWNPEISNPLRDLNQWPLILNQVR